MNTSLWHRLALLFILLAPCPGTKAATMLFDFESEADLKAFHDEGKTTVGPGKTLERVSQFATSGEHALQFSTPRWRSGLPQWPAFECKPPFADWAGFDRLVFDLTNPGDHPQTLSLFLTDTRVPTRQGLAHSVNLPPFSWTQVVVPLSQLAEKKVNPADIRLLHFFTTEPPGDMAVVLDRLMLLQPGESLPPVPPSFIKEFLSLQTNRLSNLRAALAKARERTQPLVSKSPALADWVQRSLAEMNERISGFQEELRNPGTTALQAGRRLDSLSAELSRWEAMAAFRAGFETIRSQVQVGTTPRADVALGLATSMEKILPRDLLPPPATNSRLTLSLARNEKESLQVLVLPCEQDLKQVQLRVSDLRSTEGTVFASTNVQTAPVGYVQTKTKPPYGASHVGWWPDPILDFLPAADIAKGDLQSFWVRVRAPRTQAPGTYTGKLEVLISGARVFAFDLAVTVYSFALPDRSPLPLAITFSPEDNSLPATEKDQAVWRRSADYPVNAWRKHRLRWADFLADYYISSTSLYHHQLPDFEVLERLQQQGRLDMFNLGYYGYAGATPAEVETWKQQNLPRFRAAYQRAKELGMLKHAYIYGCDEVTREFFPQVQKTVEILKAEFPDVLVMTTTYDQSYGMESVIKGMDAFCPLTPSFDPVKAARARAAGKQVWWYICCGPHHPHLNTFIEYPAIEGRLLMGAMTTKYRPDGFLYYQISIWNSQRPIESGPFTDWDPRSWTTYHGDGSWTCVGPGGTPLSTVRLENFRDGLEDYAYAQLLETAIAKVKASPAARADKTAWLAQAQLLLEVPAEVLKSKTEYTRDPAVLYRYRNRLADAIEASGLKWD